MKKTSIFFLFLLSISCQGIFDEDKGYKVISYNEFQKFTIQDTLVNNTKVLVLKVGESVTDEFPQLVVKSKRNVNKKYCLFEYENELENDSIMFSYYPAFIIDSDGSFRKNGIWVYTTFYTEGSFPFQTEGMKFAPDSVPNNWKKILPKKEGIYFYENDSLKLISNEQSEKKFEEKRKSGFYFIPNNGRLFNRININQIQD